MTSLTNNFIVNAIVGEKEDDPAASTPNTDEYPDPDHHSSDIRSQNVDEIYKTLSKDKASQNKENNNGEAESFEFNGKSNKESSRKRGSMSFKGEEKTIGNAWSPFSWYRDDKKERRYSSSSDEEQLEEEQNEEVQKLQRKNSPAPALQENSSDTSDLTRPPTAFYDKTLEQGTATATSSGRSNSQTRTKPPMFSRASVKKILIGGSRNKKASKYDRRQSVNPDDVDNEKPDKLTIDRAKKLIGSLAAGAPAINVLASCLLEDEHGIGRAPLLLSLLGFTVTDVSRNVNTRNRRFRIDLEYGVGTERMKWSVIRTAKDLLYLHSRFKLDKWRGEVVQKKAKEFPKYPLPPSMQRHKKMKDIVSSSQCLDQNEHQSNIENDHPTQISTHGPHNDDNYDDIESVMTSHTNHTARHHMHRIRSRLSIVSSNSDNMYEERLKWKIMKNQEYISQVSKYLYELIAKVSLTPQSNRVFQFFEISPISSLLSYEKNFSGKQGSIHIGGTAKSQGWRVGHFKANDLKGMIDRRQEKWLLIRGSYIMYVSDINSTIPLEVFLVDSKFNFKYKGQLTSGDDDSDDEDMMDQNDLTVDDDTKLNSNHVFKHLKITLENSERQLVIIPKSKQEQKLWIKSLEEMKSQTIYSQPNRFDSFAPVRHNCFAQWMVDGRDHFWAISSALEMATDVIFIHDWWLSPELYLRRPANGNQEWRLDRVLKRKAEQGVKIFVIVYRNVGTTVATDSLYTKHSILSLDEENIHVIRSPNQLLQNTYFWAHHEKLCIVDYRVAFVGGIDLCYGRFDTPDHVLADDAKNSFGPLEDGPFQIFPGKDYSNPRVKDFFSLEKPYESMYDRDTTPRMPWHDVHMVTSGQVAVDLARHFVQRWNYLLRQKRPSRPTPLLTPPPEISEKEAEELGLNGTCEIQLLRSSGSWSLGLRQHEQSIQNAYLKLIETSEHFIYIENQFFITSCVIDGNEIKNRIGDALVDRIIRAHQEGKPWRAVIVIPLMPGFESQVDEPDGSSVRVIMQCQFMTISRGATSIFAKLRKYGIEPDDYIQFFSLRKWDAIGRDRTLVTEQLYIHAKTMIVDDRAAIIGSANINERSMRGVRDSEVAAIVRDTETVETTMNGEPYLAGKFPHTLRMRLMREHLGVDVDALDLLERRFRNLESYARSEKGIQEATTSFKNPEDTIMSAMVELAKKDVLGEGVDLSQINCEDYNIEEEKDFPTPLALPISFNNRTGSHEANKGIRDKKKHSYDPRVQQNLDKKKDVEGYGPDGFKTKHTKRVKINSSKILRELSQKFMLDHPRGIFLPHREEIEQYLIDDPNDPEEVIAARNRERWVLLKKVSYIQRTAAIAQEQREAESKRRVAIGMPKNLQLKKSVIDQVATLADETEEKDKDKEENTPEKEEEVPIVSLDEQGVKDLMDSINPKFNDNFSRFVDPYNFEDPIDDEFYEDIWFEHARRNTEIFRIIFHSQPDNMVESWKDYKRFSKLQQAFLLAQKQEAKLRRSNSTVSVSDSESSFTGKEFEGSNVKSVRMDDQVNGLLGHAPLDVNENNKNARKGKKSFKGLRNDKKQNDKKDNLQLDEEQNAIHEKQFQDAHEEIKVGEEGKTKVAAAANEEEEEEEEEEDDSFDIAARDYDEKTGSNDPINNEIKKSKRRRRRFGTFSARRKILSGDRVYDRETAERILNEINGHLVCFPADWLVSELEGGNWFYNTDRIPPMEIYD